MHFLSFELFGADHLALVDDVGGSPLIAFSKNGFSRIILETAVCTASPKVYPIAGWFSFFSMRNTSD